MRAQSASTPIPSAWNWALVGTLLGMLLATLLFAPARWAGQWVESLSEGRVLMPAARGTVWNGSAQWVLTGGDQSRDSAVLPSRLHWHLTPGWGHLSLRLGAPCCTAQDVVLLIEPGWGKLAVRIEDSQSNWPASLLAGLGTPWNTLQPAGTLNLETRSLALESAQGRLVVVGQARLTLNQLSSALTTIRPMGNYRLSVIGGTPTRVHLETLQDSALQLVGSGTWVDTRLHFDGSASADKQYLDALSNLLNIIGRRNGAQSIIHLG